MQPNQSSAGVLARVRQRWVHLLLAGLLLAGGLALAHRPVAAQATLTCVNKTTANGLGSNVLYGVYASGSTVYAGTPGGLSISTDGGATFTNYTTANGLGNNFVIGVYASGSTVYATTNGGLSISTDGGVTFTTKTTANGLGNNSVRGVYASGSTVYAATTGGGVSISTDGGNTFTNYTTANGLGNNNVLGVYASGSTVYAATMGGLSISTNDGATWSNKTTANGLGNNLVIGVYASGSTVYAATYGGFSISTDGGNSFTNKTTANGLGNNVVTSVYASSSTIYAATRGGLSISTDGGATFTNYTTAHGLGNNSVPGVYAVGSTVYAATEGGGLSICTLAPLGPAIQVQGNGITIAKGDSTPDASDGTHFGPAAVGGSAVVRTFTLKNTGGETLTLSGTPLVALSGANASDFTVTTPPASSVAAGSSTTVAISFSPSAAGLRKATVTIASNDSANNPYTFALWGGELLVPAYKAQWGGQGNNSGQFNTPAGTAIDGSGNLYVTDGYNHRVQKFTKGGAFLRQWGSKGSNAGQFNTPTGVAVDSSGNVYIADSMNQRIQKFDSNGNFLSQWGSSGSGNGQFRYPTGVTVAANGFVYVSDTGNQRMQLFSSSGVFQTKWGTGAQTRAKGANMAAQQQSAAGQFNYPTGVAVDGSGAVYIANSGSNQIQKFDSAGTLLTQWGAKGSADGQFNLVTALVVDSNDNVYVADTNNNRIQMFDNNGTFLTQWGANGADNGQFNKPVGLAIDSNGTLYVVDAYNHRVEAFGLAASLPDIAVQGNGATIAGGDTTPRLSNQTHFGGVATGSSLVRTFTINNTGTTDLSELAVSVSGDAAFSVSSAPAATVSAGGQTTFQLTFAPSSAGDATATVSIANNDADENPYTFAVQGLGLADAAPEIAVQGNGLTIPSGANSPSYSDHRLFGGVASGGTIVRTFTVYNIGAADLTGLAVTVSGSPAVSVSGSPAATVNAGGSTTFQLTFAPTSAGRATATVSLANNDSDENPTTFVVQGWGLSAPVAYVSQWGAKGSGNGQFDTPLGVRVDSNGNLYVADSANHRIQKFSSTGSYVTKWGAQGSGNGQVGDHFDVAVDRNSNVYVIDTDHHRVQKFTSTGSYVKQWGAQGSGNGQFSYPAGLAVDQSGNVYVADTLNHRIQKFDSNGNFLAQWGSQGNAAGQFNAPAGLATDPDGNVYVADTFNHRIQKFDRNGAFLAQWGSQGSVAGLLNLPFGVAADHEGNLYVVDRSNQRIQKFTSSGDLLTVWGTLGNGNGQFNNPYGVDVDSNGNVYVVDTGNHRIQKFGGVGPALRVPTGEQAVAANNTIQVPVQFTSNGKSVAAVGFALTYDTSCLSFNPADADNDGIPEAITGLEKLPANFVASVNYTDTTKLLGIGLYQPTPPVTAKLSDGTLFTTTFTVQASCLPSGATTQDVTVGFAPSPAATFGNSAGQDMSGTTTNGTITLYRNNAPTAIALDTNTIAENSPVGTPVGELGTTDLDAGDVFTYTLVSGTGSTDNASFIISGRTLSTRESFDYETKNSYSIRVRTTDKRGAAFEGALTINVADVNEAPTALALSNNSVAENSVTGTTVGTFNTTDPDTTDNFTYELVSGDGSTDNATFTIVGGALQTSAALDYETKPSYTIRVRSTDKGGLITEQSFTISVNNVYEAPTGISNANDGPSSDGNKATFDVNENVATGTTIATLAPANPDSGNSYTYALVSGDGSTDNATFTIAGGLLQTNAALDYETKSSYSVRVRITDSQGATFEQVLTILVNDLPEAPVAVDDVVDPRTTVFLGGVAGTIDVLVNDLLNAVGQTLSVAAITQPATGNGSVTNNTTNVSYLAPPSGHGSTSFTYQATNGNGNSNSATVAVTYVANDQRGDCNGNGSLTAADFIATVLEIFDNGNTKDAANQPAWWLIYSGSYPGSPRGCDSNASRNGADNSAASVTAADIICTVRLFFGYACGSTVQAAQATQAAHLAVADAQATAGASTALTVNLNTGGNGIAAATFALTLDPAALHFADTDADGDGVPDAIALTVPAGMNQSVTWNAQEHRLEVAVFGMSLPLPTLSDGALATVTVQVAADAPASTPLPLALVTMSDTDGNDLPSTQANGTLTVQGGSTARASLFLPLVAR